MFFENNVFASDFFESYKIYERMGYHKENNGHVFRFWQSNAESVFLVGDFCGWANGIQMFKDRNGVWEIVLSDCDLRIGDKYKFKVLDNGTWLYVTDPFAFCCEWNSETASVIYPLNDEYIWKDKGWLDFRGSHCLDANHKPMNVYKIDLSLWNRYSDGGQFNYKDIAIDIAPYVKQMGYTHIELVGLSTRLCCSVGDMHEYSLFAPTSELGSPKDFKLFVDSMHEAGIGVVLNWIEDASVSQCNNYEALKSIVLSTMCRSSIPTGENKNALEDTCAGLKKFLISNLYFWIREYHIDGISCTGIESTLYFQLLKVFAELGCTNANMNLNEISNCLKSVCPDVIVLGSEENKFFMPKRFADIHDVGIKFSALRLAFGCAMTYQTVKRTVMGTEMGQNRAEALKNNMPWFLLDNELNARLQLFVSELNHLYLVAPLLWNGDAENVSVEEAIDTKSLSLVKKIQNGNEFIIIMNFSENSYKDFSLAVSQDGVYEEVFNSNKTEYGGNGILNFGDLNAYTSDNTFRLDINVPSYGMMIIKHKS